MEQSAAKKLQTTHGVNKNHVALYLLMRRISKDGQKEFMLSGALAGLYLEKQRPYSPGKHKAWSRRKRKLVDMGLVEVVGKIKDRYSIYKVPVPFAEKHAETRKESEDE